MAQQQTAHAKGLKQSPYPDAAGELVNVTFMYDLAVGRDPALGVADTVEMGVLPGGCKIVDAVLIGNSGGVCTATVGLMSGTPGDTTPGRTVGTDYFAATTINNVATRMSDPAAFDVMAADTDRSIGCTISAAVAQAAGRYVKLLLTYRAGFNYAGG